MPVIPDPTHQEPILDSLNIDDIPSLHQWGLEGLRDSVTQAIESRSPTDPVNRITLGSIMRSQQRQTGSVQTNLFGGNLDDPAVGSCRHIRQLEAELREQTGEERRVSKGKDDLVADNLVADDPVEDEDKEDDEADEDDEDEEEEEDLGYGDSRDDDEDDDSPPASLHRPVTRSTPKKKPVSRPKRKAYQNQSGPGSSSRKRTRDRQ